jgi:hypothetical protein
MPEISRASIEQRAHKIWIAKGRRDGHALADWVQAETELRAESARGTKPTAPASGGSLATASQPPKGVPVSPPKGAPVSPPKGAAASPGQAFSKGGAVPAAGGSSAPAATPSVSRNGGKPGKNADGRGKKR